MRMKRTHLGTAIGATAASVALGMALAGPGLPRPRPTPCRLRRRGGVHAGGHHTGSAIPDEEQPTVTPRPSPWPARQARCATSTSSRTSSTPVNGEVDLELPHTPPRGGGPPRRCASSPAQPTDRGGQAASTGRAGTTRPPRRLREQNCDGQPTAPSSSSSPRAPWPASSADNPNGTWTLTGAGTSRLVDTGTLNSWTLDVRTATQPPRPRRPQNFLGAGGADPRRGLAARHPDACRSRAPTPTSADLDLGPQITHGSRRRELEVKLTSPCRHRR